MLTLDRDLDHAKVHVRNAVDGASRILAITGAGASASAGLPTFRGEDGWWRKMDPEKLATRRAFEDDPVLVWTWYLARIVALERATTTDFHRHLAALESRGAEVTIFTQNVDDLHEKAGSRRVIHVHGRLMRFTCLREGTKYPIDRLDRAVIPPACRACGGETRPDIVWFDEDLDESVVHEVEQELLRPFDLCLVVGTSATFEYVREWAQASRAKGANLIEINPEATPLTTSCDVHIGFKIEEVFAPTT